MSIPTKADVVIIGAGIVGTSAAYFLSKIGLSVVLCEKGEVAGEQSSRNWGFVRQQGRDPAEIPAIIRSVKIWNGLSSEISEDVGYVQSGSLYLANTEQQLSDYEAWLEHAKQYQIDTRILSKSEALNKIPHANGKWIGALTTLSDGRAEPSKATTAISRAAERHGANIITNCAVRGLEFSAGKISGVVTEFGPISTNIVLCAAGAWSSLFCGRHGVELPQLMVRSSVFRTGPAPLISDHSIWCKDVALRRRQDGGYTVAHGSATEVPIVPNSFRWMSKFLPAFKTEKTRLRFRLDHRFYKELTIAKNWKTGSITPFEKERINQVRPSHSILKEAEASLKRLFPELKDIKVLERWAGLIDVTPDAVPVISPVSKLPGFYLATGFSGHGFGIGPAAGELAAGMITGSATNSELKPFALTRFF
ncbi:MAG: NAD(P)/FAD-dependent oxidoreductase [Thalassobaculaceae bacterium]